MTFQVPPQCLQKCFFPFDGHADQLLFSLTRHFSRSATTLCAETARAACPPALSAGTTSGGGRPSGTSSRRGRCWGEAHERRNDCQNCEEDKKIVVCTQSLTMELCIFSTIYFISIKLCYDLGNDIAQESKYSKIRQVSGSLQKSFADDSRLLGPKNY